MSGDKKKPPVKKQKANGSKGSGQVAGNFVRRDPSTGRFIVQKDSPRGGGYDKSVSPSIPHPTEPPPKRK
jgi:hypothetical protein